MPDQLNLFDVLLGRTKPNPDMRPVFTPQDQAPPSVLDPAIDFVRGLGYFPTEPVPQDAGKAYGAGAMLSAGAPLIGAFKRWRPVVSEVGDIISGYQPIDPLKQALASRVTPKIVFPSAAIDIPSGFELPEEFGPNRMTRPAEMYRIQSMYERLPQKPSYKMKPKAVSTTKELQTYEAPASSAEGLQDIVAKPTTPTSRKDILGGGSTRRKNQASRLTETQVGRLKGMLQAGLEHEDIAKQFGVDANYVGQIARGESWNRVKPIPVEKAGK